MNMKEIKKLDETVVNRIAAGEIIHRPSSAIKELIENSIDAQCTLVSVSVKGGGLEWMQIQDNGKGIHKDDLPIVCERFTTSKLQQYDDLKKMSTFGFRGEALASISHVSVLTILSKTQQSPCAYKAKYQNGKNAPLVFGGCSDIIPCAGSNGTTITIEDLFYNLQIRKQSLKSSHEEYQRVLDIMIRYSIHFGDRNIRFVCKKVGSTSLDVNTDCNSSKLENIRKSFGSQIYDELMPLLQNTDSKFTLSLSGYITNTSFVCKRATFILFINDRLVECKSIRQAIESAYAELLSGHSAPFIYLSLSLPAENVDVNVHPTKNEVHFLFEEEVVKHIHQVVLSTLNCAINSKKFSILSVSSVKHANQTRHADNQQCGNGVVDTSSVNIISQSVLGEKRTNNANRSSSSINQPLMSVFFSPGENIPMCVECDPENTFSCVCCVKNEKKTKKMDVMKRGTLNYGLKRGDRASSAHVLSIESSADVTLSQVVKDCIYIGSVDDVFSVIQSGDSLWLVDHALLMESLFYQILVMSGGELLVVQSTGVLNIVPLIVAALKNFECDLIVINEGSQNLVHSIASELIRHRKVLNDYFGLSISTDGDLLSVPVILVGITTHQYLIPSLLLNLGTNVRWDDPSDHVHDIAIVFAKFFRGCSTIVRSVLFNEHPTLITDCVLRDVIFPFVVHSDYMPPIPAAADEVIFTPITSLSQLYKVFERC